MYVNVERKSGFKHGDADPLFRSPVDSAPAITDDDDNEHFLGAVNLNKMTALQQRNPELCALIEHLENEGAQFRVSSRESCQLLLFDKVYSTKRTLGTTTRRGCW